LGPSDNLAAGGAGAYACDSADFDGTNDYLHRASDWTSNADSDVGIFSVWFQYEGGNGSTMSFMGITDGEWNMTRTDSSNIFTMKLNPPYDQFSFSTGSQANDDDTWHHLIFSWNAAANYEAMYLDGNLDANAPDGTNDFNWTQAAHSACANVSGSSKVNGMVADLYLNNIAHLDLGIAANMLKFRSVAGKPVDLGADGSTPTGSAPRVFLHLDVDETAANFAVNAGTGGDYVVTGGGITTGASSPTD
jgi:hypothetical protein